MTVEGIGMEDGIGARQLFQSMENLLLAVTGGVWLELRRNHFGHVVTPPILDYYNIRFLVQKSLQSSTESGKFTEIPMVLNNKKRDSMGKNEITQ